MAGPFSLITERKYVYRVAQLVRDVDGDTFDLTLERRVDDFGFYVKMVMSWTARFRLLDVDTWETNQAGGAKASHDAAEWIGHAIGDGVLEGASSKTDHFGRWLIDLYRTDTGEHLAAKLISLGDAKS